MSRSTAGSRQGRDPDFKALYRKLEGAVDRIQRTEHVSEMLANMLSVLVDDFKEELGIEGARLYKRAGDDFVLCGVEGSSEHVPLGYRIPRDYPPHARTLREGLVIMGRDDPAFDENLERTIGVPSRFAAITLGEGSRHIMAFSIRDDADEEKVLYSLYTIRHVINLRLQQERLDEILHESRIIQESLLPQTGPEFAGFDIHGRSRPAETVGGDAYDYLHFSDQLLGIAIADASGHGLPAALLARDIVTGLRVGMSEDLKIVKVIERLNRVIHRAVLSSRFISLFYGELDSGGTLVYCNAGHTPPIVSKPDGLLELTEGGLVLGPSPSARYETGHVRLDPGDTVLLFTDGLTERESREGEQFGIERVKDHLRKFRGRSAEDVVDSILVSADTFSGGTPADDDITVVAVRRL